VHSSLKAPAAIAILVPILVLGLPVIDTLLVMALRFLDRPKGPFGARFQRMFRADRNHLHHMLLRLGGSRQAVVVWIYAAAAAFCLFALLVAFTRSAAMAAALMVTEIVAIAMMRGLGLRGGVRQLAANRSLVAEPDREQEPLRRRA
jgi:UDP-GlcNAc:undecaprenyl-phosphate GlcNAc-1-phosphate transferase